jgi:NAD(P)-dependent dehydrogenase (short-subunit alcohol dehydrogenase family)
MKNKTVLITGGSSGIGEATALLFAKNGANIVITYRKNKVGAEKVKKEIEKFGVEALIIQADLIKESDAKKVIEKTIKEFGKIDVLVNNAGRYINGDEWDGSSEIWIESLKQNLVSAMNVSKYATKIFQKQKSGIIVNVASRYSKDGQYDALSYSAAKAGIANITQAYARLLAPYGRVNTVSPSAVKTGYWLTAPKDELEKEESEAPLLKPEEVAHKILFLASDEAQNITGQNISIDRK